MPYEHDALESSTVAAIEALVDRAAKRVGRQPDLEARRDTIREAVAEALGITTRAQALVQRLNDSSVG